MDSKSDMFMKRAKSELESARILFVASREEKIKQYLKLSDDSSYYSGAISHAYYSIFFCAKAVLSLHRIDTKAPNVHSKTLNAFKEKFIDTGLLDIHLLKIYKELIIRAETLLEIFRLEKKKRGNYTYNTIAQANIIPAEESINNAKLFFKHCNIYLINN